jgi:hypothetical protein
MMAQTQAWATIGVAGECGLKSENRAANRAMHVARLSNSRHNWQLKGANRATTQRSAPLSP